jgi:hypothetical protein
MLDGCFSVVTFTVFLKVEDRGPKSQRLNFEGFRLFQATAELRTVNYFQGLYPCVKEKNQYICRLY